LIWAHGDDARGDVGGFSLDRELERFDRPSAWGDQRPNVATLAKQADGFLIEELRVPREHHIARHLADMEAVYTWEWLSTKRSTQTRTRLRRISCASASNPFSLTSHPR
jgi:hypothetical protein